MSSISTINKKSNSKKSVKDEKQLENYDLAMTKTSKSTPAKQNEENEEENDEGVLTKITFDSLGLTPALCKAVSQQLGWKYCTKIQAETLPPALKEGRDVIGLAETGSGKTGAFCLPILQDLLLGQSVRSGGSIFAVILTPTRELAFQIYDFLVKVGISLALKACCIVGGVDRTTQAIALARNPHVIVATPGRLVDHLEHTKGFHLRNVMYLILDEADRMLSLDFEEEVNTILSVLPDGQPTTITTPSSNNKVTSRRKTMLFSATMTSKVQKLQRASLYNPVKVQVSTKFSTPSTLLQYYLFLPAKYKDCYFVYLMNEFAGQSILVFGATCKNVQRLALLSRHLGFPAICLHGQMSQPKRLGALNKFTASNSNNNKTNNTAACNILICTDVASRGLDIPNVDVVIQFDLPGHGKDYIHRVGRTARAGRAGRALSMVTQYDVEVYQRIEGLLGKRLPEYKTDEETVLVLLERVSEAQRMATRELREQLSAAVGRNGHRTKRQRRGLDQDEGEEDQVEQLVQQELKKNYRSRGNNKQSRGHQKKRRK